MGTLYTITEDAEETAELMEDRTDWNNILCEGTRITERERIIYVYMWKTGDSTKSYENEKTI